MKEINPTSAQELVLATIHEIGRNLRKRKGLTYAPGCSITDAVTALSECESIARTSFMKLCQQLEEQGHPVNSYTTNHWVRCDTIEIAQLSVSIAWELLPEDTPNSSFIWIYNWINDTDHLRFSDK